MPKKVKSYKRRDGSKVKAHVRKVKGSTQAIRERRAGRQAQRDFAALLKGTKPRAPRNPRTVIRKDLNKLLRTTKRKNAKAS